MRGVLAGDVGVSGSSDPLLPGGESANRWREMTLLMAASTCLRRGEGQRACARLCARASVCMHVHARVHDSSM